MGSREPYPVGGRKGRYRQESAPAPVVPTLRVVRDAGVQVTVYNFGLGKREARTLQVGVELHGVLFRDSPRRLDPCTAAVGGLLSRDILVADLI